MAVFAIYCWIVWANLYFFDQIHVGRYRIGTSMIILSRTIVVWYWINIPAFVFPVHCSLELHLLVCHCFSWSKVAWYSMGISDCFVKVHFSLVLNGYVYDCCVLVICSMALNGHVWLLCPSHFVEWYWMDMSDCFVPVHCSMVLNGHVSDCFVPVHCNVVLNAHVYAYIIQAYCSVMLNILPTKNNK